MHKSKIYVFFFLAFNWSLQSSAEERISVCQTDKAKYEYRIELANLLLDKTADPYGAAQIAPYNLSSSDPTQSRCELLLENRQVRLVYLPVTEERLKRFDAVKIDLHNGMLGYRALVIRKEDQERFRSVKSIEDLRQFKGGFGQQWGDFKLFALNELPVVGVIETKHLYRMLSAGRFDYFHRGLHEAWEEVEDIIHINPDLQVEESMALAYDFPVYFMVNPADGELKQRLMVGFDIVKLDGSFQQLFLKYFGQLAEQAKLEERNIIRIQYPLPGNLPPIDTSIWLH